MTHDMHYEENLLAKRLVKARSNYEAPLQLPAKVLQRVENAGYDERQMRARKNVHYGT